MTVREINNYLIGKTITKADVDGFGIVLEFEDGSSLVYSASDGGYSSFDIVFKED